MTMPSLTETRRNDNDIGERMELGPYRIATGVERVLYGQRVANVVRATDVPVERPGRAYLVERGLEEDGYTALLALVDDYLVQANQLGVPPMSTTILNSVSRGKSATSRDGRTLGICSVGRGSHRTLSLSTDIVQPRGGFPWSDERGPADGFDGGRGFAPVGFPLATREPEPSPRSPLS
jgi:hypothetical protein